MGRDRGGRERERAIFPPASGLVRPAAVGGKERRLGSGQWPVPCVVQRAGEQGSSSGWLEMAGDLDAFFLSSSAATAQDPRPAPGPVHVRLALQSDWQ